ncbi:hypothetical protein BDN72DRAFT_851550, partial [Pluteus cervinus]
MSGVSPPNHEDDGHYEEPSTPPPISCLPSELLTRILFTLQSLHELEHYYRWTSVSQVSQSWRQLVLETTSLWGGIIHVYSERPVQWAIVSLERSGSATLDITIYTQNPKESISDFVLEVLSQMHRIRSLKLTITWFDSFDASKQLRLLHLLESPAPCLEEVALNGGRSAMYWAQETHERPLTPILSGIAPRLRVMRLFSLPLSLKGFSCTTIVHLVLGHIEPPAYFHLDEVLSILRTSPKIESLHLNDCAFSMSPSVPITPITLPRLRKLELPLRAEASAALLSHLSLPSTAHVSLHRELREFRAVEIQSILPEILHSFGRELPPIGRLSMILKGHKTFVFHFWELDSTCQEPRISLNLFCVQEFRWLLPCSPSFLSHLRSLYISAPYHGIVIEGQPMSHFSSFATLSEIQIGWGFVPEFVEYFKQEPNSFPALKSLSLHLPYAENEVPHEVFNSLSWALELRMQGPHG